MFMNMVPAQSLGKLYTRVYIDPKLKHIVFHDVSKQAGITNVEGFGHGQQRL